MVFNGVLTAGTGIGGGKRSEGLLQIVYTVHLFFYVVQLDAHSCTGRGYMFEGSSSWKVESFLEFLDEGI